jgi:hypothetical protein
MRLSQSLSLAISSDRIVAYLPLARGARLKKHMERMGMFELVIGILLFSAQVLS